MALEGRGYWQTGAPQAPLFPLAPFHGPCPTTYTHSAPLLPWALPFPSPCSSRAGPPARAGIQGLQLAPDTHDQILLKLKLYYPQLPAMCSLLHLVFAPPRRPDSVVPWLGKLCPSCLTLDIYPDQTHLSKASTNDPLGGRSSIFL